MTVYKYVTFFRDLPMLFLFGCFIVCVYLGWAVFPLLLALWLSPYWAATVGVLTWWLTVSVAHAVGYFET